MEVIPKRVFINEVYIETYSCEDCEKDTGFANVIRAVAPERLLKHSLASPNTVADVMKVTNATNVPGLKCQTPSFEVGWLLRAYYYAAVNLRNILIFSVTLVVKMSLTLVPAE